MDLDLEDVDISKDAWMNLMDIHYSQFTNMSQIPQEIIKNESLFES